MRAIYLYDKCQAFDMYGASTVATMYMSMRIYARACVCVFAPWCLRVRMTSVYVLCVWLASADLSNLFIVNLHLIVGSSLNQVSNIFLLNSNAG